MERRKLSNQDFAKGLLKIIEMAPQRELASLAIFYEDFRQENFGELEALKLNPLAGPFIEGLEDCLFGPPPPSNIA